MTFLDLLKNFFTHKDFLPPASELPGTMFTPLHFVFAAFWLALVIFFGIYVSRRSERTIKRVFLVLWIFLVVLEIVKIVWESCAGDGIKFEWGGVMPLYPCSIFMYAMPLVIWGKGLWRRAGCGYVCTLGFLGGANRPTPLTEQEFQDMNPTLGEDAPQPTLVIGAKVGDIVRIKDGAFMGYEGNVQAVDETRGRLTVVISIFGRSTPVDLEFWQVEQAV